jgi:phosphatidylserine/phosphatidylglycerophosphate/cardiolipin synthase-like enzyme
MNFNELLSLYQTLLVENRQLKGKIKQIESLVENGVGNSGDDKKTIEKSNKPDNACGHYQELETKLITKHAPPTQKPNIHQKFAIIDQKIVWYGSINLLSYGSAEESMMRIESNKIAYELMGSLKKTNEMFDTNKQ